MISGRTLRGVSPSVGDVHPKLDYGHPNLMQIVFLRVVMLWETVGKIK